MSISSWAILHHKVELVQFGPYGQPRSIRSNLAISVQLGLLGPILSYSPLRSIRSIPSIWVYSVQYGPFGRPRPIQSNLANSVQLGLFRPIWSIWSTWSIRSFWYFGQFGSVRSNLVHMVILGPFGPVRSIRSNLIHTVHLGQFGPFHLFSSI